MRRCSRFTRADALLTLLDERDFGLLTSVLSFLHGLVIADSGRHATSSPALRSWLLISSRSFYGCLSKVVRLLERLAKAQDIPQDYLYYGIASPWMQARPPHAGAAVC